MSGLKEKPQIEFIFSLHKIKDAYLKYNLNGDKEISDLIDFYSSKEIYSDQDLITLQVRCESEWQKLLLKICESIIKKVENNNKREKIYVKEFKEAKIKQQRLRNNSLKLGEYETLFDAEIESLKQEFDSRWERDKLEWRRFWLGLIIGFILGILGSVLVNYFF